MSTCGDAECQAHSLEVFTSAAELLDVYDQTKTTAQSMYEYHKARQAYLRWRLRLLEQQIEILHHNQEITPQSMLYEQR